MYFLMYKYLFLGAFTKFRKATICLVMSVRPSVRLSAWNYSAPTARIFMKFGQFLENCRENTSFIKIGYE